MSLTSGLAAFPLIVQLGSESMAAAPVDEAIHSSAGSNEDSMAGPIGEGTLPAEEFPTDSFTNPTTRGPDNPWLVPAMSLAVALGAAAAARVKWHLDNNPLRGTLPWWTDQKDQDLSRVDMRDVKFQPVRGTDLRGSKLPLDSTHWPETWEYAILDKTQALEILSAGGRLDGAILCDDFSHVDLSTYQNGLYGADMRRAGRLPLLVEHWPEIFQRVRLNAIQVKQILNTNVLRDIFRIRRGADRDSVIDLMDHRLRWADLRGQDLSNVNLKHVDLQHVDLRGAILPWPSRLPESLAFAHLDGAQVKRFYDVGFGFLQYVNLSGANLAKAQLGDLDLEGADLSGANLKNANLTDANLSLTNLDDAELDGALLVGANFRGSSLSGKWNTFVRIVEVDGKPQEKVVSEKSPGARSMRGAHIFGANLDEDQLGFALAKGARQN